MLHRHPDVLEAAVVGMPHPYRGETVCAYVALTPGCVADTARFDAYCRERLAAYKVPRSYEFVDALPKTGVGKVDKIELRKGPIE